MPNGWKTEDFNYKFEKFEDPYSDEAPWPCMRGNIRNSGVLRNFDKIDVSDENHDVMHFTTGNAIFSTPVIGKDETIYVGSADHKFYALDPLKSEVLWEKEYVEIVDSAACIDKKGKIYIGAGDAKVHAYTPDGKEIWTYDAINDRQKQQLSFSSNYWYEANIVMGPDGAVYVANDDFFLYKMTPYGDIIWGYRTGFLIWSAAAFWEDGTVYIAGFDHILYALDMNTGKNRWKCDVHGALVASPAVGIDGTIYQCSFNGNIYAVNHETGKIKWTYETGNHIYASPIISDDNMVYFGSTNGTFYALNGETGELNWTFYIGDAIRSSAALGPDPEAKDDFLIYFGGGNGKIYALEPNGTMRWSYNTLLRAENTEYPNINASIALGYKGIATAVSTGDIVWLPYNYYLRDDALGIETESVQKTEKVGVKWHHVTPGGRFIETPYDNDVVINPINTITLRLLNHTENGMLPVQIDADSVEITPNPYCGLRTEIQSDGATIHIIPDEILQTDTTYALDIKCNYELNSQKSSLMSTLKFCTAKLREVDGTLFEEGDRFKLIHMASPLPPIVPSLDQIGLASLTIPFNIVYVDEGQQRYIAWAVQKFGEVGVPQRRISHYGFSGIYEDNSFLMEAKNCLFEITAMNIPIDNFRIAGVLNEDNAIENGGSLHIEKYWGKSILKLIREMGGDSPITFKQIIEHLKTGGLMQFLKGGWKFVGALLKQATRNAYKNWGLINSDLKLMGIGTFKMVPIDQKPGFDRDAVKINSFGLNDSKKAIYADVLLPASTDVWEPALSVCLFHKDDVSVVPINYSAKMKIKDTDAGKTLKLKIPKKLTGNLDGLSAMLLVDMEPIKIIELKE